MNSARDGGYRSRKGIKGRRAGNTYQHLRDNRLWM